MSVSVSVPVPVSVPEPDAVFGEPRLASIYDQLEPDRPDLKPYLSMVAEFGAHSVLDIGCGTGTFACLLAHHAIDVTGLDPAAASLAVAARKPLAQRVRWFQGDTASLPPMQVDLVTMTGNVAQVFLTDDEWITMLSGARARVRPGGRLVFEARDPSKAAWRLWDRAHTYRRVLLADAGSVETWVDVTAVDLPLVSFRQTFVFEADGAVLVSDSTLRFRAQTEIESALRIVGFDVEEVRGAADRPGLELVFIARREVG